MAVFATDRKVPGNHDWLSDLSGFEFHLKQINNLMVKYQFNDVAKLELLEKFTQLKKQVHQIVLNQN
jgi:hypothetical protein